MAEVGPFGFNDRFGCEGEGEGERGERGERGKRGHRGERGHRGPAGSTGPTGPSGTGSGSGVLLGRQVFDAAFTGVYAPTPGTTFAIVRGSGGGGGGGGVGIVTAPGDAAGASGGNSGIGIEVSVGTLGGIPLTGGPITVGAGGAGGIANSSGSPGGDSTLVIGGVTLTAPGGQGGNTGGFGFIPPVIIGPQGPTFAVGVDYQAADLGGNGFALTSGNVGLMGGNGGSGDFGVGGVGANLGDGINGEGNGAGGGGASNIFGTPATNGGDGTDGLWIVEEYA